MPDAVPVLVREVPVLVREVLEEEVDAIFAAAPSLSVIVPLALAADPSVYPEPVTIVSTRVSSGSTVMSSMGVTVIVALVTPAASVSTPGQVRAAARYLRNRTLLRALLAESPDGIESPLEHQFNTNVVVAHGLPLPERQRRERVRGYWIRSDCWYERYGLRVELDGELAHPGRATSKDVLRDNDVLLTMEEITLRFRWWHTLTGSCVSAAQLAGGLYRGGYEGGLDACGPDCTAPRELRALRGRLPQTRRA